MMSMSLLSLLRALALWKFFSRRAVTSAFHPFSTGPSPSPGPFPRDPTPSVSAPLLLLPTELEELSEE